MSKLFEVLAKDGVIVLPDDVPSPSRCLVAILDDDFDKLLAVGFSTILAIQVFVNIGGVIKLIPLTGITLPFISRGGFSFIITYIIIGFMMGLSHRNGKRMNS